MYVAIKSTNAISAFDSNNITTTRAEQKNKYHIRRPADQTKVEVQDGFRTGR